MDEADGPFERVLALCRDVVSRSNPKMKWMWGEALFGFALSELDAVRGTEDFTPFLKSYCGYWAANPPAIDYADRAAPALITYAMQKKTGDARYGALTKRVLDYIRNSPRLIGEAVNHLGNSPESRFYPRSIWVDSLMMFSLFPALYAAEQGDRELLNFAARQPAVYSQYMQDSAEKLWRHSYWVKAQRPHPKAAIFWGRGNGWALYSLPRIMDCIGQNHSEFETIRAIFTSTAGAALRFQNEDGSFNTILNRKSCRELSATALIAAGFLRGARRGLLPEEFREAGNRAFLAVTASIGKDKHGLFMPEISGPTIPLQVFPGLAYRLIPRGKNWSYGLAAAAFAAIEYRLGGAK